MMVFLFLMQFAGAKALPGRYRVRPSRREGACCPPRPLPRPTLPQAEGEMDAPLELTNYMERLLETC
jgi:hypothetical protein